MGMWKIIEEFPKYEINQKGEVRNVQTKIIKSFKIKKGRVIYRFRNKNKSYERFRARLIGIYFIYNPDPLNKTQVNHIDENTLNDNINNLEWSTPKENVNHGTRNERASKTRLKLIANKTIKGRSKKVYQYDIKGNLLASYENALTAAKIYGYNHSHICKSCRNKKELAYGFNWSYSKL